MSQQATATSPAAFLHLSYGQDPLQALSTSLLQRHAQQLPDLSRLVILLDEPQAARGLRHNLLEQATALGHPALLAPRIEGLASFVSRRAPLDPRRRFCNDTSRELILIEALQQHPLILGKSNPWVLAEHLLNLFDELSLNLQDLPADLEEFSAWLQQRYAISGPSLSGQSREATLIHTLWLAWHTELEQRQLIDRTLAYTQALQQDLALEDIDTLYYAGSVMPRRSELHWLQRHLPGEKLVLCLQGQGDSEASATHPGAPLQQLAHDLALPLPAHPPGANTHVRTEASAYSHTLDQVYAEHRGALATRARTLAQEFVHSPLQDRLSVFLANSAEQEARAVDIQIRQWLLQGKTNIAVVCENRRLSRRLRAILERADVALQDTTGWALSTTSASTTLERWLECIEEDFAYAPLLDLLASVFVFSDYDPIQYKRLIFRFEQDIIQNENIARNLDRYRDHIRDRSARLESHHSGMARALLSLLDQLDSAARPLLAMSRGQQRADEFLGALQQSLVDLGAVEALNADAAGRQLLQELQHLQDSAGEVPVRMGWSTFRNWLGRHLEQCHFRPSATGTPVRLMGLAQTQWQHFDAVIIAAAEQSFLPGNGSSSPFFNESVRQELGLSTRAQHLGERFYYFRRLLESAPHIVITACQEHQGEPVALSPWLERLLAFHDIAWGSRLHNTALAQLSALPEAQVCRDPHSPLPPIPEAAVAVLPETRRPQKFSASDYQCLLDCPYQYFAARSLSLSAPEEVRLALSKADYGSRIHQCLDALHTDRQDLPGPFGLPFCPEHRAAAITLLNEISIAVFAQDLQDHFSHQGWLQKWQNQIPAYIDWEIARAADWQVAATEIAFESTTPGGLTLRGRVDRLEQHHDDFAVVDYKTGAVPKPVEVECAEKIQLPFYTLLSKTQAPVTQVSYLGLDPVAEKKKLCLEGEALQTLALDIQQRLDQLVAEMAQGQGLPAWGDSDTCRYCDMNRICRRSVWETQPSGVSHAE
ncbi:MAG: PD-(D/E)XK nuclease family protein [Gammaproteobacteria bacterium]